MGIGAALCTGGTFGYWELVHARVGSDVNDFSVFQVHNLRSIDISTRMRIFHSVLKYVTLFMVIIAADLPAVSFPVVVYFSLYTACV